MALLESSGGRVVRFPFVDLGVGHLGCDKMKNGAAIEPASNAIRVTVNADLAAFAIAVSENKLEQMIVAGYRSSSNTVDPRSDKTDTTLKRWHRLAILLKLDQSAAAKAIAR